MPLDHDERVRRPLVIHAQRGSRVPPQRLALDAVLMRGQDDVIAVEQEPDRRQCGRPSRRVTASFPVLVPAVTNSRHCASVIFAMAQRYGSQPAAIALMNG